MKRFTTNSFRRHSSNVHCSDVSLDHRLTVGSPSGFDANSLLKLVSVLVLIFTFGIGQMWAEKITINKAALTHLGSGYDNGAVKTDDIDNVTFTYSYLMYTGNNIQAQATNGNIYNSTLIPGKITNVAITHTSTGRSTTIYMGTSSSSITTQAATGNGSVSGNAPANTCPGYFKITRGGNAAQWTKIEVTYTPATITLSKNSITNLDYNVGSGASNAQTFTVSGSNIPANLTVTAPSNFEVSLNGSSWASTQTINVTLSGSTNAGTLSSTTVYVRLASGKSAGNYNGNVSIAMAGCNTITNVNPKTVAVSGTVTAAACTASPSVGAASLNGSINWSSSPKTVPFSVSSVGGGSNCTLSEYGFVWKAGSAPTISDNKTKIGESSSATSFNGNISGSFALNTTYYVKAYAKNNGDNVTLSTTATTFTPRSVDYNKNESSASGSVAQQVLISGGTVTLAAANSFTWTGHHIEKWAQGSASGTQYNPGSTSPAINASTTFYAIWALNTHTLTWNVNSGDELTGSYTKGTVEYGATITAPANPTRTGYTFAGWHNGTSVVTPATSMPDNNLTYTAQWTINNYTITWMVNGVEWSGKGGSANANYNTAWSSLTLPTAPVPNEDGCGHKFIGWTTTANYSNATTAPSDLLNSENKSSKTGVKVTNNVIFHAVFADYDDND